MDDADPQLLIRPARQGDLDHLVALYRQLNVGAETELPIDQARRRLIELIANPGHQIFVAEQEQRVVGTFSLIFLGGLTHGGRDSCIVEDVVVSADRQRSGIGRTMMRFALDRCAQADCYKLVLSSHLQRGSAHLFYESLGYAKHGYSYLIEPGAGRASKAE